MAFCRTCRYLGVPPDKAGRVVPRPERAYECQAPIPAPPPLPASVYVGYERLKWPPSKSWMTPDMGEDCAAYEVRDQATKRSAASK